MIEDYTISPLSHYVKEYQQRQEKWREQKRQKEMNDGTFSTRPTFFEVCQKRSKNLIKKKIDQLL